MRTANDLRNHLLMFKNDIDEHYKLLVPEIRNGLVLYINIDLASLNKQETVRLVSKLVPNDDANLKALSQSITRLLASVKDMKKCLSRTWDNLVSFLNQKFTVPLNSSSTLHVLSLPHYTSGEGGHTSCPVSNTLISDCHKCANRRIALRRMFASKVSLKAKLLNKHSTNNKRLSQALSRKKAIEAVIRSKLTAAKKEINAKDTLIRKLKNDNVVLKHGSSQSEVRSLRRLLAVIRSKFRKFKISHTHLVQVLKRENNVLRHQVHNLKADNDILQSEYNSDVLMQTEPKYIDTKSDGKSYSTSCRKAIYYCLEYHVPVTCICPVIEVILNQMAGLKVTSLPEPSTVSYLAYELGVLSDLQVGEIMYNGNNITLSWDSTTINGEHINEVHISVSLVPPKSYVLSLRSLAGGTTEDYMSHICDSINSIIATYAAYHGVDYLHAKSRIIKHLKNTLSDRVAVNHCVVQQLESAFEVELLELKCIIHPLDGIAKKCTNILKVYDNQNNVTSDTFGRDCCAVNFIIAMNKMRFKQGKGDPSGFKQFLRQNNIKQSIIIRYVGNRFHVLFHLAGDLYYLRTTLVIYLEKSCNNNTTLRTSLVKDLRNINILLQLRALGIIGKMVTGPWMHELYTNSGISNLDSINYIKMCLQNLNALKENPLMMLQANTDTFGVSLDVGSDAVVNELQNSATTEQDKLVLNDILVQLLEGVICVIKKQLHDYLEGTLTNLSPSIVHQASSAPVHNMFAEHTLGMADYLYRKASNIKVGFLDGKVKCKINGTMQWLCAHSQDKQEDIVKFCIRQGQRVKLVNKQHEHNVSILQDQRIKVKIQKKENSLRRKIEKKLQCVAEKELDLSNEFQDISECKKNVILSVLSNESVLNGLYFEQLWYVDNQNVLYNGHIICVKQSKKSQVPKVVITYWKNDECEEEGDNVTLTLYGLLADYIMGDLNLDVMLT